MPFFAHRRFHTDPSGTYVTPHVLSSCRTPANAFNSSLASLPSHRFHTDPSGTYVKYDAKAIGSGSEGAQTALQESYRCDGGRREMCFGAWRFAGSEGTQTALQEPYRCAGEGGMIWDDWWGGSGGRLGPGACTWDVHRRTAPIHRGKCIC